MSADARMTKEVFSEALDIVGDDVPGNRRWSEAGRRLIAHDAAMRAEINCLREAAKLVLPADLNAERGPYVVVRKEDLACLRTAIAPPAPGESESHD